MKKTGQTRTMVLYGMAMAAAALGLQWLEYSYAVRVLSAEVYIVVIALGFMGLGLWVGHRLTKRPSHQGPFERNSRALGTLGTSDREVEVLELVAGGVTNKEIAKRLIVSPNTVKTHLANLYGKLGVSRRTQAIQRAREFHLIP